MTALLTSTLRMQAVASEALTAAALVAGGVESNSSGRQRISSHCVARQTFNSQAAPRKATVSAPGADAAAARLHCGRWRFCE